MGNKNYQPGRKFVNKWLFDDEKAIFVFYQTSSSASAFPGQARIYHYKRVGQAWRLLW